MKIAFVSTILHYRWGGADALWTPAAEAAVARGDRVLLALSPLTAAHPRIAAMRAAGAIVAARSAPAGPPPLAARLAQRVRSRLGARDPLLATLGDFQPDLVVFSLGGTYDLVGHRPVVDWLERTATPFHVIANFQEEHPSLSDDDIAFTRAVFDRALSVNFNSTRNLLVTRRHLLSPLAHARVFQYPLRWQPSDRTPWPESPFAELTAVARLERVKGLPLLLHALAEIGAGFPDWRLHLHGTGPQEPYLRATAAHLGLQERVQFHGFTASLRDVWARSHLFVSPALDEGVPMTIPEAMLCGRPVLATCVGGAEDWLRHGETGFLCPAPTVPLLAATLREAARARPQWPAMGAAAADAALARYRAEDHLALLQPVPAIPSRS